LKRLKALKALKASANCVASMFMCVVCCVCVFMFLCVCLCACFYMFPCCEFFLFSLMTQPRVSQTQRLAASFLALDWINGCDKSTYTESSQPWSKQIETPKVCASCAICAPSWSVSWTDFEFQRDENWIQRLHIRYL
jgi:hypothetical protein